MKTVICNWKMNPKSFEAAKQLFNATKKISLATKGTEIIVLPPTIFLRELAKGYRGTRIEFGAQNAFWEQEGSHTGETSPTQVKESGVAESVTKQLSFDPLSTSFAVMVAFPPASN